MTDGGSLLRVEDADFGYDGRAVVRGARFGIGSGDLVGVHGPNGSGKTTLLRGLIGLVPRLRGIVERRPGLRIGYVPQRDTLDPLWPLSALDVVLLAATAGHRPWQRTGETARARARAALADCRSEALARVAWRELSGGQRQRVLVARALALDPDLLLLDEPTAGIDADTSAAIIDLLDGLRRARPLAIWLVTHDEQSLAGRADRIARVEHGRVQIEEGPP
jgi:ABC-type Mn2+/Zn2+ transport system ATPase subunit